MTTFITNGNRATMLPRVLYDDYNRPTRNSIVSVDERPVLGETVTLRDFDGDFQSECVVVNIKTIAITNISSRPQLFVELHQVGGIEYL